MKYKITIEYVGTAFSGWQRQSLRDNLHDTNNDIVTVQQTIEHAIKIITKEDIVVFGAGRTDTGVHAFGQVAHFSLSSPVEPSKLLIGINALVRPHPVSILNIELVEDNFDARMSAKARHYIYKILIRQSRPVIEENRMWWINKNLDLQQIQEASQFLIGQHDFSAFRAKGCQSNSPIKTINSINWKRDDQIITMEISAKSFLYHQVRNIVGTLVYVGLGKLSKETFLHIFQTKNRALAGPTAPPYGLYFKKVDY